MTGTYNDPPSKFLSRQRYLSMELAHGGTALDEAVLKNAAQAVSIFEQVVCALAVGEMAFFFEHRDLHGGNVLLEDTVVDENDQVSPHLCFCLSYFDKFILSKRKKRIPRWVKLLSFVADNCH